MIKTSELDVRLSSPVTHVAQSGSSVTVTTASGDAFMSKACTVAVPSNVLRRIEFQPPLSTDKREATGENHVGRGYKISMIVDGIRRDHCALAPGLSR